MQSGHGALLGSWIDQLIEEPAEREAAIVPADQVAQLATALMSVVRRHVTDEQLAAIAADLGQLASGKI